MERADEENEATLDIISTDALLNSEIAGADALEASVEAPKPRSGGSAPSCRSGFVFYMGLISAVYHAVVHAGIVANVNIPWWIGAIGVALSAILMYCNGKKPKTSDGWTDDSM